MYGGIEDAANGAKIQPTADVYSMKLHLSKCRLNRFGTLSRAV